MGAARARTTLPARFGKLLRPGDGQQEKAVEHGVCSRRRALTQASETKEHARGTRSAHRGFQLERRCTRTRADTRTARAQCGDGGHRAADRDGSRLADRRDRTAGESMLEAYTTLGYLAAVTQRVRLHALVTAVVYRRPGLLAKMVTTLDVLSGGRAGLGLGAAWNDEESRGLGLPFPSTKERFERLEEAIRIVEQMWSEDEGSFTGEHYTLARTLNSPQSLSRPHPYLMIGGSGERKTLRLVARHADACNIFSRPEAAHKLAVLREHCER